MEGNAETGTEHTARKTKSFALALLSSGWLAPLYFSFNFFNTYMDLDVVPRIDEKVPLTGIPYLRLSRYSFLVACIWLALVIIAWAFFIRERVLRKRN